MPIRKAMKPYEGTVGSEVYHILLGNICNSMKPKTPAISDTATMAHLLK